MTTITYPDVTHKKAVSNKFNPNSYRVLSEDVAEYDSIPSWYGHARPPPFYTDPSADQLPAQAIEPRNNPHAARKVDMVYTNASTFNAPVGIVKTDNVKKDESRWWDWSSPKGEPYGPGAVSQDEWKKTNESSYRNAFHTTGESGSYAKKNTRYSANPNHIRTVGIVPITQLKPDDLESVSQALVEKVSFEQQYNSRNPSNYPVRGQRHGAFIIEEDKPPVRPMERPEISSSAKIERATSMWDLFHPGDNSRGPQQANPFKYRRPLPQIQRTDNNDQVWHAAPYANDYQFDPSASKPPLYKQTNIDRYE